MARSPVASAVGALLLASLGSIAVLAALGATNRGVRASDTGERYGETVVVAGDQLTAFAGSTADELWVWTWHTEEWHLLPSQMDERDAGGNYVADEGDGLDEGDELVFPLDLAGVAAPSEAWPPGIERRLPPMVVRVTDPLDPALGAYAYVFLSRGGPEIALKPLITFDRDALELRSDAYVLGFADSFADGFVGYKRLSLQGSDTDLLDRLKIRIAIRIANVEQELTEEQLDLIPGIELPGLTPNPVIAGPVRIVLDAGGAAMAYQHRFELVMEGVRDIELPTNFDLTGVRCSLDFSALAAGSEYSDQNSAAGVAIDGAPDAVPDAPVPQWRQIATEDGRLVVLSRALGPAVSARGYYKDDSTVDPVDTGDGMSYGDNGVTAPDVDQFVNAGFPGELVAMPSGHSLTGAQLLAHAEAPLLVDVSVGVPPATSTTSAFTATPTSPPATTAPATAAPTGSATSTESAPPTTTPPTSTATPSAGGPTSVPTTPIPEPTPGPSETAAGGGSPTPQTPVATEATPTQEPEWAYTIVVPVCLK